MNAPKFTPGPWRIDDDVSGSGVYVDNDNYHGVDAGRGYLDHETMTGFSVCAHMSLADTRLIAAAPDLFESLRDLLADIAQPGEAWAAGSTVERARAALAKAAP